MRIDKAIQILEQNLTGDFDIYSDDLNTAERLGIEALKYYLETRPTEVSTFCPLLPGETEK